MSYTYEAHNSTTLLEDYEWDRMWIEKANDEKTRRVLYIGDSISCETRKYATVATSCEIYFDNYATSKALDNPFFFDNIRLFAEEEKYRSAVVFNNGLHGWHLDDGSDYAKEYEKMILRLMKEFEGTPIILLLTSHVLDEKRDARVRVRNQKVCELARKYALSVIDFYEPSKKREELLSSDGVHFSKEGYEMLANELVNFLQKGII